MAVKKVSYSPTVSSVVALAAFFVRVKALVLGGRHLLAHLAAKIKRTPQQKLQTRLVLIWILEYFASAVTFCVYAHKSFVITHKKQAIHIATH